MAEVSIVVMQHNEERFGIYCLPAPENKHTRLKLHVEQYLPCEQFKRLGMIGCQ